MTTLLLPSDPPQENPEAFGKELLRLAEGILPPEFARDQASTQLALTTGLDYSHLRSWMKGKIYGDKQGRKSMQLEHFQVLVEAFFLKPGGLQTPEEVYAWANAAGEVFRLELEKAWFRRLAEAHTFIPPAPDTPLPPFLPKGVERPELLGEIVAKFRLCQELKKPLILYGPSGIGKSTLMAQLERAHPLWHTFCPDGVLAAYLSGGTSAEIVETWYQSLTKMMVPIHLSYERLIHRVRDQLNRQRKLLLIDDVARVEEVERLFPLPTSHCVMVITTHNWEVAQGLAHSPAFILHLPGFSENQSWEFAQQFFGELDGVHQPSVKYLTNLFNGNPLALKQAFHVIQDSTWEETLLRLQNPTSSTIVDNLPTIYRPMALNYLKLSPTLQESFRFIGALPWLASYPVWLLEDVWALAEGDVRHRFRQLVRVGLLQQEGDANWHLHQGMYLFAQYLLRQISGEAQKAETWKSRSLQRANVQTFFKKINGFHRNPGLKRLRKYLKLQKPPWIIVPEREVSEQPSFSPNTLLTKELPFLQIEEYLYLDTLSYTSMLHFLSFLLQPKYSLGSAGISIFFYVVSHALKLPWLSQVLAFLLLTYVFLIVFTLTLYLILLFLVEGPRHTALHYQITKRLDASRK
ncbi:MAG TPA: ATP-binding protein [Anaerolineales bacterium]|nr:ATP-binding protein [Anaerolineales bacterium]